MLRLLTEAYAGGLSLSCRISHIFRMIADSFNIIYNMEQGSDALLILNGQCGLVDFNQIVGNGDVYKRQR